MINRVEFSLRLYLLRRIPRFLSFLFALFFCANAPIHPENAHTNKETRKKQIAESKPLIVAHRGGSGLAPENTLEAFMKSLSLGVDAVELDVHLSKDGVPVVIHDPLLSKTTNGTGLVEDFTLQELKTLDAGVKFKEVRDTTSNLEGFHQTDSNLKEGFQNELSSKELRRIPTLEEVLALIRGKVKLQLEIKVRQDGTRYPGIEQRVIERLRKYGMVNDTMILSFDFPTLQAMKELEPGILTCALLGARYLNARLVRGNLAIAEELAKYRVDYAGVDERKFTPELLEALRQRGIRVGVWTVNDEDRMRYFLNQGVEFITSDRPDILKRIQ